MRRMDWTVADLLKEYKQGRLSRRQFIALMTGAGISMTLTSAVLAGSPSHVSAATPTRRGGGGTLKLLWAQGPVLLNAHLAAGAKDSDGSRLFTEPLAAVNADAELVPVLAAEIPSLANRTLDKDGKWVIWRLKKNVAWHDGKPFTADDVVFTWEYAADPATGAITRGTYGNIQSVEKIDSHSVRVNFAEPTPVWGVAFVGPRDHIFPKHLISAYKGQNSRNSPYNMKPVGTGPYKIVEFRPGDQIVAEINPNYHMPNRPSFDRVEIKGGGDAVSAARAVLQTGEYDYAWNVQIEPDMLANLEKAGIGRALITPWSTTEHLQYNYTDPWTEVDGERSSVKTKHPFFSDLKVRQAFSLAVNRKLIAESLYGPGGSVGVYMVFSPKKFWPGQGTWEYSLEKAGKLLDEAGWMKGPDGIRAKGGTRMKVLFQTAVNPVRQKTQAILKKDLESLGVQVELKSIANEVYFSTDPANPDTRDHFYADMQMYTDGPLSPDPQAFMEYYTTWQLSQKANRWAGRNVVRYQNPRYDALWNQAKTELDPVKRADLFKRMNQILRDDVVVDALVNRNRITAVKKNLQGIELTPFDSDLSQLAYWYRG